MLEWKGKTPVSTQFDDVYFSAEDGLAESTHVFLTSNNLPERFKQQTTPFTIYELGFGTGLNFLNVFRLWKEYPNKFPLNFVSCEKYPLNIADMERSLQVWPELKTEIEPFLQKYAELNLAEGWHILEIVEGLTLSLYVGDGTTMLKTAPQQRLEMADAWFLDGFAPAKNPEMWTAEVFEHMAKLSKDGTTFATFTAAGTVRRGLQDVGFDVRKVKGFGRKRDMTVGTWCANL
jgi:tRNA 5-methylaminomethyl-2-thiouridine biosynthesis bifunctional protein